MSKKYLVLGYCPTEKEKFLNEVFTDRAGLNIKRIIKLAGIENVVYDYVFDSNESALKEEKQRKIISKIEKHQANFVILLGTKLSAFSKGVQKSNTGKLNVVNARMIYVFCTHTENYIFMSGKEKEKELIEALKTMRLQDDFV